MDYHSFEILEESEKKNDVKTLDKLSMLRVYFNLACVRNLACVQTNMYSSNT